MSELFIMMVWISGAFGFGFAMADSEEKTLSWIEVGVFAVAALGWPLVVTGMAIYQFVTTLDVSDKTEET